MAKNNKDSKKNDANVNLLLSMATIQSGTVKYTNSKVGGLKKKLVDSIMRMIGSSISQDIKNILASLGVEATLKKTRQGWMIVNELYLRDKNVKGSKRVKVRTSYENDYEAMKKEMFSRTKEIDIKNCKEISDYCNAVMGQWSDFRGSYDKMYKEDLKVMQKEHEKEMKELQKKDKKMSDSKVSLKKKATKKTSKK